MTSSPEHDRPILPPLESMDVHEEAAQSRRVFTVMVGTDVARCMPHAAWLHRLMHERSTPIDEVERMGLVPWHEETKDLAADLETKPDLRNVLLLGENHETPVTDWKRAMVRIQVFDHEDVGQGHNRPWLALQGLNQGRPRRRR
jgi:hypothetical protein